MVREVRVVWVVGVVKVDRGVVEPIGVVGVVEPVGMVGWGGQGG